MTKKIAAKVGTAALGAAEFIDFIHSWGHPEWVLLGAEAPLEAVAELYARRHSATERLADVPIRLARKTDSEIASWVALVQPLKSSWTLIYRVLCLPIDEADLDEAARDAQQLSAKLKSRALTFVGEDTSFAMGMALYQPGKPVRETNWSSQNESADKAFAALGLYLPACYPCERGSSPWLAAVPGSFGRIERAEFIQQQEV